MLRVVDFLTGLLTLAYVLTGIFGVVDLVFFWNFAGFLSWTLVSIGLAVVRFLFIGVTGMVLSRSRSRAGDGFRQRFEDEHGYRAEWFPDQRAQKRDAPNRARWWVPQRFWSSAVDAVIVVVGVFGGLGLLDRQFHEVRSLFASMTGSGTDCGAMRAWVERVEEWSGQAALPAESIPVNSPYREMHFEREEARELGFRDDVLASDPPEDAQGLSAEMAAHFEIRAGLVRAVADGDYVTHERLMGEAERSGARINRMAVELDEKCN